MRDNLVRKEIPNHNRRRSEVHLVRNDENRHLHQKNIYQRHRKPSNKIATKNSRIRTLFIRLGFVMIFALIVSNLDTLFSIKTYHGIMQNRAMYAQPENTVDVVFMGSSHIHCDVNTALLWDNYGIAGYDYSAAEQPIWMTYYYLKEFCKNQDPELVVVDLYSIARFGDDFNDLWMPDNVYGMNFSLNKVNLMLNSCSKDQINKFFPSFSGYHNRYNELEAKDYDLLDIKEDDLAQFKGYTPYYGLAQGLSPSLNVTDKTPIPPKSKEYLQKIIDYTKDNEINLMLIVNPYPSTPEEEKVYNSIEEMARENSIEFINMNKLGDAMGLNTEAHYNDESHLNYEGSCVFSNYLGECLKLSYILEDHRGKEEYKTWDAFSDMVDNSNVDILNR